MITPEHTQEALSQAFVHALAGVAGINIATRPMFDYGIDGTFYPVKIVGGERVPTGFPVDFQMKATTRWEFKNDTVVYDLEARTHRLLTDREPGQVLAILILLCLPDDPNNWLDGCEEHLLLKNCCYWYRPEGPPTQNASSVRIWIPRANLLTPGSLKSIMELARKEAKGQ